MSTRVLVSVGSAAVASAKRVYDCVRTLSGDDAYERYLDHHATMHTGTQPLSRKDFFREEQDRKWDGINRCC